MNEGEKISNVVCFELKKEYPGAKIGDLFFLPKSDSGYIENTRGITFPLALVDDQWFDVIFTKDKRNE